MAIRSLNIPNIFHHYPWIIPLEIKIDNLANYFFM